MSEMTKEEIAKLPRGLYLRFKCDNPACLKPINGTLVYLGKQGNEYCSNSCYIACEDSGKPTSKGDKSVKDDSKKKKKNVDDDDEDTPKKKGKAEPEEDDEDTPKKKKKSKSDDEDTPKKKKKSKSDDDDDEKPAKKAVANNPYPKVGSIAHDVFEMAKAGTTRKKITKLCEERECSPARLFRELKLEEFRNVKWRYAEDDGNIKVTIRKKKE